MKRIFAVGALLIAVGMMPTTANASLITQQFFCNAANNNPPESNTCPDGVTASLKVETDGAAGTNQYLITLTLDTQAIDPSIAFIKQVEFAIPGVKGSQYEAAPPVDVSGVSGSGASGWQDPALFDNINNGGLCGPSDGTAHQVCTEALLNNGTNTGDVDVWLFHINLVDTDPSAPALTGAEDFNLRAQFLFQNGGNAGILSPGGANVPGGGGDTPSSPGETPTTPGETPSNPGQGDTSVPEPTSLVLLGSGLAYVGARLRRRRSE